MAAIDKICEYSGNYTGYPMYNFKRNHIQIEPQYRKFFRGKKAVLTIAPCGRALKEKYKSGRYGYKLFYEWEEEREYYDRRFYNVPNDKKIFEKWLKYFFKKTPVTEYEYTLEIIDENWTCPTERKVFKEFTYDNPKHVIRRMKRLVGSKNITIVKNF
ncbi:MAG: hypothetical protein [Caudoviricetes sp.]|nr:MAG: hypothetical protein [Caudoviricetes sp.]